MVVLICGGRNFGDLLSLSNNRSHPLWVQREQEYYFIMDELNQLSLGWPKTPADTCGNWLPKVTIIAGGCPTGVDQVAIDWAVVNWCPFIEFKANWKQYGRAAGPIRNAQMLRKGRPDLVVAFPGGAGTANMLKQAKATGVRVIETRR